MESEYQTPEPQSFNTSNLKIKALKSCGTVTCNILNEHFRILQ